VVIHTAATRALQKGTTLDAVIDMVTKVAPTIKAPLVLFTYFNPIIRRGMDTFCAQIKAAGASGGQLTASRIGSSRLPQCWQPSRCLWPQWHWRRQQQQHHQ
jgi:hypothetical protein